MDSWVIGIIVAGCIVIALAWVAGYLIAILTPDAPTRIESNLIHPDKQQPLLSQQVSKNKLSGFVASISLALIIVYLTIKLVNAEGYQETLGVAMLLVFPGGIGFFMLAAKFSWIIKAKRRGE